MPNTGSLLRALRDFVVAALGLVSALILAGGGSGRVYVLSAFGEIVLLGCIGWLAYKVLLPGRAARAMMFIELQTFGIIGGLYVASFAGALYGLGQLASRISGDVQKYWLGAASGFILSFLAAALIKPGEGESWIAVRTKKVLERKYQRYFGTRPNDGAQAEFTGCQFLEPDGVAAHAIWADRFYATDNTLIAAGWAFAARRTRARMLDDAFRGRPPSVQPPSVVSRLRK